jgi:hypothetical protein
MDEVMGGEPGNAPDVAAGGAQDRARPAARAGTAGRLEDWVDAVVAELGIPRDVVDVALVLDLARDAAHGVDRPAAPLTTFLVGYAAGAGAPGGAGLDDLVGRVGRLAREWADRPREGA